MTPVQALQHARQLLMSGQFDEAAAAFQGLYDNPQNPPADRYAALLGMSDALFAAGKLEDGGRALDLACQLAPNDPTPAARLAYRLAQRGSLVDAQKYAERAMKLQPNHVTALLAASDIAASLSKQEEALSLFDKAAKATGQRDRLATQGMLLMHYADSFDPALVLRRSVAYGLTLPTRPCHRTPASDKPLGADKVLKVGYVSPDFNTHPVAMFLESFLPYHSRQQVEITAYHTAVRQDAVTVRLKDVCQQWRDVALLPPEHLAWQIAQDGIDILVDLAGHSADQRLATFALNPAPIQITYLGYPNTTGLSAMGHRLTDAVADPPMATDKWHCETLVRLGRCAWSWKPDDAYHAVSESPARKNGSVTFASLNNSRKVTPKMLRLWGRILTAVPNSKLLIKGRAMEHPAGRAAALSWLTAAGAKPQQIETLGELSRTEYLELFSKIDVALDTYPYHGTTTTLECLYHGLPVVTLEGVHHVSRVSVSLLHCLSQRMADCKEWICRDEDQYISACASLAKDAGRLAAIRSALRPTVLSSPLTDGAGLAAELEGVYRQMWAKWISA